MPDTGGNFINTAMRLAAMVNPKRMTSGPTWGQVWDNDPELQKRMTRQQYINQQQAQRNADLQNRGIDPRTGQPLNASSGPNTINDQDVVGSYNTTSTIYNIYSGMQDIAQQKERQGTDGGGGNGNTGGTGGNGQPAQDQGGVAGKIGSALLSTPLKLPGLNLAFPLIGGALGALSAFGKAPEFNRRENYRNWADEFDEQYKDISRQATANPFEDEKGLYRRGSQALLSTGNAMIERDTQRQFQQEAAGAGTRLATTGTQRALASIAPSIMGQQTQLMGQAFGLQHDAARFRESSLLHNTDQEQAKFFAEVDRGIHPTQNRGLNLANKAIGGFLGGAGKGLDIARALQQDEIAKQIFGQMYATPGEAASTGTPATGTPATGAPIAAVPLGNRVPSESAQVPVVPDARMIGWYGRPPTASDLGVNGQLRANDVLTRVQAQQVPQVQNEEDEAAATGTLGDPFLDLAGQGAHVRNPLLDSREPVKRYSTPLGFAKRRPQQKIFGF